MFLVETIEGDILASKGTLEEASQEAKRLLEDDPERRELSVARYEIERTVTFGPTWDWDTEVVVLKPGERITAPPGAFLCTEDDIRESCGYDLSDPKHPDWHSVHADLWDNREKV